MHELLAPFEAGAEIDAGRGQHRLETVLVEDLGDRLLQQDLAVVRDLQDQVLVSDGEGREPAALLRPDESAPRDPVSAALGQFDRVVRRVCQRPNHLAAARQLDGAAVLVIEDHGSVGVQQGAVEIGVEIPLGRVDQVRGVGEVLQEADRPSGHGRAVAPDQTQFVAAVEEPRHEDEAPIVRHAVDRHAASRVAGGLAKVRGDAFRREDGNFQEHEAQVLAQGLVCLVGEVPFGARVHARAEEHDEREQNR